MKKVINIRQEARQPSQDNKRTLRDDGDLSDYFRAVREDRRERNSLALEDGARDILALAKAGYDVVCITPYQYRINGRLDLYPTHRKFHDIKMNKRGRYFDADRLRKVISETFSEIRKDAKP